MHSTPESIVFNSSFPDTLSDTLRFVRLSLSAFRKDEFKQQENHASP